jgi:uncharacterized iron-regulated protein
VNIGQLLAPCLALLCLIIPAKGCARNGLSLWDVAAEKVVTLQQILPDLEGADMVLVGEQHDHAGHHAAQLEVIKAFHQAGKPVAVALEMFEHSSQPILGRWSSGGMEEETFVPHFQKNWGDTWLLYRDIFLYCRDHRIPMVGVNVPRAITSHVARNGFASLTPEQMGLLPMVTCRVDPDYLRLMREAHGHGLGDEGFRHFCEAQLVWDTAMAAYSLEYLARNPQRKVVLLAGSVHAWKKGIPARVREQNSAIRTRVILPESPGRFRKGTVTTEDADYLILAP